MKIIIGLGNPGQEYADTRHNVGMMLVDKLVMHLASSSHAMGMQLWGDYYGIKIAKFPELWLVKSKNYYMNESGKMLKELMDNGQWTMDNLFVVHDDLDIRLGEYKIQMGTGPKVHGGVNSIENQLKSKDFWRIRIGIENRDPSVAKTIEGKEYVLQRFNQEERKTVDKVFEEILNTLTL